MTLRRMHVPFEEDFDDKGFQNLNKMYLRVAWVFSLVLFFSSCQELVLETQGDERAECEEGYEFKTITRRCESIVIKNAPPKAH